MRTAVLPSALAVAVGLAFACVWACLPEVEITPPAPIGPICGDGVITPDAGEECDPGPDASPGARTTCSGCKVVCPTGSIAQTDPSSHHCYFFLPATKDFTALDAGAGCEESLAHLVRFVSPNEVSFVQGLGGEGYWVGLAEPFDAGLDSGRWDPIELTNEPGWSGQCAGCFAWIDAGAAQIPPAGEAVTHGRCVAGYVGDPAPPWTQFDCVSARAALCEREPVGTRTVPCAQGAWFTVAATQSTKSYVLVSSPQRVQASAAVAACGALDAGLIVFQSPEEREQVGHEIGTETVEPGANDFWIGLAQSAAGAWAWDRADSGLNPPPWGVGEPAAAAVPLARAYVVVEAGVLDSELAHAQTNPGDTHYAVCEFFP